MKSIEALITTMNLISETDLLQKMNIQCPFIIGNQTSYDDIKSVDYNSNKGIVVSKNEIGVGKNRNSILRASTADICVLADDDLIFYDGMKDKVLSSFEKYPADVLIFNLDNTSGNNNHPVKINIFNYMHYGAARFAFIRSSVIKNNIFFNENFGGGTQYSSGEDNLFIRDCLSKGLKVMAVPVTLASLSDLRKSTWFEGYTDKYLFDKGVLLATAHPILCKIFALYLTIKHKEYSKDRTGKLEVFNRILDGIKFVKMKENQIE